MSCCPIKRHKAPRFAWLLVPLLWLQPTSAQEQTGDVPPDIQRMVRDGMAAALEARLGSSRKPRDLHLLAQAYAAKADRIREDVQRQKAFEEAERRYRAWITTLENRRAESAKRDVEVAQARVELAGMILSRWAARGLDEFELTGGGRGERAPLVKLLQTARELYEQALGLVEPLLADLDEREDEYFALGIYETMRRLRLDISFNLGWTGLYQGILASGDGPQRAEALRLAEREFRELLDSGRVGTMGPRCHLGSAMALREQGRRQQAEDAFRRALTDGPDPALAAQVRYELARCQIAAGKFEEARITLRPLLDQAGGGQATAQFYVNLARIWDANSYLVEADALRDTADNSPARKAVLLRARRLSDTGLGKMYALAARGGAWPALVQLYVAERIEPTADPKTLSSLELLFAARHHAGAGRYRRAEERFRVALTRDDLPGDLLGQILFELGTCQYRRKDLGAAAETFARLAAERKKHPRATQAATLAYQLRARIAEESKRPEDYRRLADVLAKLLDEYPEPARKVEAAWWLPVALQAAGRFEQAAERYAKVPAASPHWEEARFREQLCKRFACEAAREALSSQAYARRARNVAGELVLYARQAEARASSSSSARQVRNWSAAARVYAAELLVAAELEQFARALGLLEGFEQRYPDSGLMDRVLAVHIRARHGLRQFDEAARLLERYLQEVPAEKAGGVLSGLAQGMQAEVERLSALGEAEAARNLAAGAITTFERLEAWCRGERQRAENLATVSYGLARMCFVAGRLEQATSVTMRLLEEDPRNGDVQRLHALILDAEVNADPSAERIRLAKDAWALLLRDPALRTRAPERYWEARCHWLALLLREGRAADVAKAIEQDRIWSPTLGGPPWREKLEALLREAAGAGVQSRPTGDAP